MSYLSGTAVRQINLSDPTRRIDIIARDDGAFQAFENLAIENDPTQGWTPYRMSGIYRDVQEVENAVREMWEKFDFGGMTVNERLYCIGAFAEFDQARKVGDKPRLVSILGRIGLESQANEIIENL